MNIRKLNAAILILVAFTQLTCAEVTSWVTKPVAANIPDSSDSLIRMSDNGRFVAFYSHSANLVDGDTNLTGDVFVKDTQMNSIALVSSPTTNRVAAFSKPSANGQLIALYTGLVNLVRPYNALFVKNLLTNVATEQTFDTGSKISLTSSEIFLSDDGRYLIFETSSGIDANDTNGRSDVYRKDLLTGAYTLITVNTSGNAPSSGATLSSVSRNGRYVAFWSQSMDIHPDATTGEKIGYIKDLQFSTTHIFGLNQLGEPIGAGYWGYVSSTVSNSGKVYFCSRNSNHVANDNNTRADLFKYDSGIVTRLSFASIITEITDSGCRDSANNSTVRTLSINDSETSLIFSHQSLQLHPLASALAPYSNIYKLNFSDNSVELLSQHNNASFGINNFSEGLAVSADHSKVAYISAAQIINTHNSSFHRRSYIQDLNNNTIAFVATPAHAAKTLTADVITVKMSDDQNQIYYVSSANNAIASPSNSLAGRKLYHFNRLSGNTKLITGNYGDYNISSQDLDTLDVSANGRFVVYNDTGVNYTDLVLYDSQTNQYITVGQGLKPKVNNDGNVVYFIYQGAGTSEVFIFDRTTQITEKISVNTAGNDSDGISIAPDIAGEGLSTWIVFESSSTDLIANDTNGINDVFMLNWPNGNIFRISEVAGIGGTDSSTKPVISSDTTTVVFTTNASNLGNKLVKYNRVTDTLANVCKVSTSNTCDINPEHYGVSSYGRYISFSEDGNNFAIYLYDSLTDTTSNIASYITSTGTDYNKFMAIAVDDSFLQPKIGVLFTQVNQYLDVLYGINEINNYTSGFLYQVGGDGETLNLNFQGTGQVFGGLNCTADCSFTFTLGAELTLSIIEPSGQTFVGWQGDCINQPSPLDFDCHVIMDLNKTITAKFIDDNDRIFIHGFED